MKENPISGAGAAEGETRGRGVHGDDLVRHVQEERTGLHHGDWYDWAGNGWSVLHCGRRIHLKEGDHSLTEQLLVMAAGQYEGYSCEDESGDHHHNGQ